MFITTHANAQISMAARSIRSINAATRNAMYGIAVTNTIDAINRNEYRMRYGYPRLYRWNYGINGIKLSQSPVPYSSTLNIPLCEKNMPQAKSNVAVTGKEHPVLNKSVIPIQENATTGYSGTKPDNKTPAVAETRNDTVAETRSPYRKPITWGLCFIGITVGGFILYLLKDFFIDLFTSKEENLYGNLPRIIRNTANRIWYVSPDGNISNSL